ncbi:MAG: FMN-binding protein [Planctomycetes bacterium]|nr:FMN-binding protein [Planctomycetota bacterium]
MCSERLRIALAVLVATGVAVSQDLPTREEALALAFPKASIERIVVALSDDDRAAVAKVSGATEERATVFGYVARVDGKVVGVAWFDTHVIRAKKETVMIAVAPDATIARVEVVAFAEPRDYLPKPKWREQLQGRSLQGERKVADQPPIAGATLTATAMQAACRRVLAVHGVVAARLGVVPPPPAPPVKSAATAGRP